MLDPEKRLNLIELLRPPDGYLLDYAIGTTYSLDLLALLTVPLAFTFFGVSTEIRKPDPLMLLDGVRRYADKLTVFCQAGQISVPKGKQLLYSYLESTVVEVTPRSQHGVFHPKIWALRFTKESEDAHNNGLRIRYRFICLSRNLTFDHSWDTVAVLDGKLTDRKNAYSQNYPLGDFYNRLPSFGLRPMKPTIKKRIEQFTYELQRVKFNVPWPFESVDYFPMGIKRGESWPFGGWKRKLLIISPFLTHDFLQRITSDCSDNALISRIDGQNGLESLSEEQLAPFQRIFVLSQNANPEESDDNNVQLTDQDTSQFNPPLSGLHAKVFIAEQGGLKRRVHLWTGSANATNAAIKHNVEFLLRFVGRERHLSIDKLLSDREDQIDLRDLLEEYKPPTDPASYDDIKFKLEQKLRRLKRTLFETEFTVEITRLSDEERYRLILSWIGDQFAKVLSLSTVRCWPVTLPPSAAVEVASNQNQHCSLGPVSFESVTSFFVFEIETVVEDTSGVSRFVLNLPLINPPAKRSQRILSHLLSDRQRVLRYLLLLLLEGGDIYAAGSQAIKLIIDPDSSDRTIDLGFSVHLFESLTKTLAQNPENLDQIKRLVDELSETDNEHLLPEDFHEIWEPIWEARQQLSSDLNVVGSTSELESEESLNDGK